MDDEEIERKINPLEKVRAVALLDHKHMIQESIYRLGVDHVFMMAVMAR